MPNHRMAVTGVQWPQFQHGDETWVLHVCECGCGRKRVEKIAGRWEPKQLGYDLLVALDRDTTKEARQS